MLKEVCARISEKPSNSAWLSCSPTGKLHDVTLNMDLIEGPVRYRKGKKWKSRWAVLRRVNPASDALNLVMYPDEANARSRQKEKAFLPLEGFCGLQLLNKMDKHFNVIIIITTVEVIPLSFEKIDLRAHWLGLLQDHFGKEKSFEGIVPHKQKIKSGEAALRFYSSFFSLTRKDNYRCIGLWKLKALPKYGAVEGGFAFQAGEESHGASEKPLIFFFSTRSGKEIHALFDSVCRAGEITHSSEAQQETSQPGPSDEENQTQPNFFKRAWLRVSGRRPRKKRDARPRSSSMPSSERGRKRSGGRTEQSPRVLSNSSVPRNESEPTNLSSRAGYHDNNDDVFLPEAKNGKSSAASPTPGYENVDALTPVGYENLEVRTPAGYKNVDVRTPDGYKNVDVTTPVGYEIMDAQSNAGRKISGAESSAARHGSEVQRKSKGEKDKRNSTPGEVKGEVGKEKAPIEGAEAGEVDGYVLVEGRDEELLEAIRTKSNATEKSRKERKEGQEKRNSSSGERASRSSEDDKSKPITTGKRRSGGTVENGVIGAEKNDKCDAPEKGKDKKTSIGEEKGLENGQVPCRIVVTNTSETNGITETVEEETILRGDEDINGMDEENKSELIRHEKGEGKNGANKRGIVNGDIAKVKDKAEEPVSVSARRGVKTPPHLLLSNNSAGNSASAEQLSVNSPPKTADYVNVQGSRPSPSTRSRSKTANLAGKPPGSRTKLTSYAMYDGNDDSIYHSVESLMPSHPGYQNVIGEDASRAHSFENIAGHSYANVGGVNSSYQNIGASYVNVPSRHNQGNLNYIRVAGAEAHPPSPLASTSPKSTKPSSDYTWIDERRTQLLKDTARMHSDLRRENLPRVMKK